MKLILLGLIVLTLSFALSACASQKNLYHPIAFQSTTHK